MRKYAVFFYFVCVCARGGAFNPPAGGEDLPLLGHPGTVAGANAAAGTVYDNAFRAGGSSTAPFAIAINPALTANNQRFSFSAGYAGHFPAGASSSAAGNGAAGNGANAAGAAAASTPHYLHLGALFPTRRGVFSGTVQLGGIAEDGLTRFALATAGVGRDITRNLYVGAALSGGYADAAEASAKAVSDWALYGKLGLAYRLPDWGPFTEPAAGVTLSCLGKTFETATAGTAAGSAAAGGTAAAGPAFGPYPSPFTAQAGFSALVLSGETVNAGFSIDLSFPFMQTVALDAGLHVEIARVFVVSTGYRVNFYDAAAAGKLNWPFVALSYVFSVNADKARPALAAAAASQAGAPGAASPAGAPAASPAGAPAAGAGAASQAAGWSRSDVRVSGVWENRAGLYGKDTHLISAGIAVNMGDSSGGPPQIFIEE